MRLSIKRGLCTCHRALCYGGACSTLMVRALKPGTPPRTLPRWLIRPCLSPMLTVASAPCALVTMKLPQQLEHVAGGVPTLDCYVARADRETTVKVALLSFPGLRTTVACAETVNEPPLWAYAP